MASERGWRVVEFRKDSHGDPRMPFVNLPFISWYSNSAGGFADVSVDPVSTQLNHILAHPSLIFWGLLGSLFSRKNEMVVVASAPLNLGRCECARKARAQQGERRIRKDSRHRVRST